MDISVVSVPVPDLPTLKKHLGKNVTFARIEVTLSHNDNFFDLYPDHYGLAKFEVWWIAQNDVYLIQEIKTNGHAAVILIEARVE